MMHSRRTVLLLGGTAIFGVGAFEIWQDRRARSEMALVMSPPEVFAAAQNGEVLLVDIRRPDEWRSTGVASVAVPIDMRTDDFLVQLATARASADQPIAVICARGVRSARMTRLLADAQIRPVVDVPEGMLGSRAGPGWLERGLPLKKFE